MPCASQNFQMRQPAWEVNDMAYVEVEIDVEEHLDEVSTDDLKAELARRDIVVFGLTAEPAAHIIADLKKSFERNDPHEFYYLVRKIEMMMEATGG